MGVKMELVRRFFDDPGMSFFLFGPRGTGKSTWLGIQFPDALFIDLLSAESYRRFSANPERIHEIIEGNREKKTIIIDEIQKVPQLLDVIHQLIESRKDLKFILTGSSSRKLKREGVDLLAGRAALKTMHPFILSELKEIPKPEDILNFGLLPLIVGSPNPSEALHAYVGLYLNEEVKAEGLVRNMGNFNRFLEVMSLSNGNVINASEIARECQIGRKAVEGYIAILEDLLLGIKLPVFTKRTKRQTIIHHKFYFFDVGVFKSVRPAGPFDRPEEIAGSALETLVCQHFRAWIAYRKKENSLFYWRTRAGNEVDFVLYGEDGLVAIEVKHTQQIRNNDLRGLKSFQEDYPEAECLLLYCGNEQLKIGKVLCLPVFEFLKNLHPDVSPSYER